MAEVVVMVVAVMCLAVGLLRFRVFVFASFNLCFAMLQRRADEWLGLAVAQRGLLFGLALLPVGSFGTALLRMGLANCLGHPTSQLSLHVQKQTGRLPP